jgi:hypothetical protein
VGNEGHRIAFCFESDLDLMGKDVPEPAQDETPSPPGNAEEESLAGLFPARRALFLAALLTGPPFPGDLGGRIMEGVWQGRLTNDTFIAHPPGDGEQI